MCTDPSSDPSATPTLSTTPLFSPGLLAATPGALAAIDSCQTNPLALVRRHLHGDWGDLDAEDTEANRFAIDKSLRVFSSYKLRNAKDPSAGAITIWCITEADRSSTTLLLPSEY